MGYEKLPVVKVSEVIKVLGKLGFKLSTKHGSHMTYIDGEHVRVTISVHTGETVKKGTLRKMIKDMGITVEEFNRYRKM